MSTSIRFGILLAGLLVAVSGADPGWAGPSRHVIAAGGGSASDNTNGVQVTFGQPLVGTVTSASHQGASGFWPGYVASDLVPVRLGFLRAEVEGTGVVLSWTVAGDAADLAGFHVYRASGPDQRVQISDELLFGEDVYRFRDHDPPLGLVSYWLRELERDGTATWHGPVEVDLAGEGAPRFALHQNLPNPFRGSTRIAYQIPASGPVVLRIFDLSGREVSRLVDGIQPEGAHEAVWDGRDRNGRPAAAGVYFYRLDTPRASSSRKLILIL